LTQDIGGGWPLDGADAALSHVPLVWMVREAQKAGLEFDEEKLEALHCCHEDHITPEVKRQMAIPSVAIHPASPTATTPDIGPQINGRVNGAPPVSVVDADNFSKHHTSHPDTPFHKYLYYAATQGRIHDVLQFNNGASSASVVSWNVMEYLPFRRMDLQEDGTWKAITWPLPKGETRDIPANATIHCSVIMRMLADPKYRPGNLIVGGGGRGVRHAPEEDGIGKWLVVCEEGHHVGECFVRKEPPKRTKTMDNATMVAKGPQNNSDAGRKRSKNQ
jgi:hypothetical protein